MLTYRELVDDAARTLYDASETPRIDAEFLIQHVTGESMAWLIAYGDKHATAEHTKQYEELIGQRAQGKPVAYLMGYRDFWTLRLKVTPAVLIPRGDTEVLVEQAITRLKAQQAPSVLDLGTGSGAIALAIAKELPNAEVLAVDQQRDALEVATTNAQLNKINNTRFLQSDWFEKIQPQNFDLIASNPPYVESGDAHLQRGDLRFEPITALIADNAGLADLYSIITEAPSFLKPDGWLLLEHGFDQADCVAKKLIAAGFSNISLYADLNQLPRCTAAQWRIS